MSLDGGDKFKLRKLLVVEYTDLIIASVQNMDALSDDDQFLIMGVKMVIRDIFNKLEVLRNYGADNPDSLNPDSLR